MWKYKGRPLIFQVYKLLRLAPYLAYGIINGSASEICS